MGMINSNNFKKKKDLNTNKVNSNPTGMGAVDYTDHSGKKKKEVKNNKTIGVDQKTYDLLATWQLVLGDGKNKPYLRDIIQSLSNNVLNNLSDEERKEFNSMYQTIIKQKNTKNHFNI